MFNFEDREVTRPLTFKMTSNADGTVTLTPSPGTISVEGTPINKATMEELQRDIYNSIYPVGRGFIDFTNTDYSNYLGFEWEKTLLGVVPLGADGSNYKLGNRGGEATHTLTEAELPKIDGRLRLNQNIVTANANDSIILDASGHFKKSEYTGGKNYMNGALSSAQTVCNYATFAFGSNGAHNNMPPYEVVNYWKRIG